MEVLSDTYEKYIKTAITELKEENYSKAEENIKLAMLERPHSPEAHNLYGILEELQSDGSLARKHYRAAYALDPTYKPAARNLERIVAFEYYPSNKKIDYGEEPEAEPENPYVVVYDSNRVGHLYKKEME
jgi:tetratricopeptide (TPR) repeat protein